MAAVGNLPGALWVAPTFSVHTSLMIVTSLYKRLRWKGKEKGKALCTGRLDVYPNAYLWEASAPK